MDILTTFENVEKFATVLEGELEDIVSTSWTTVTPKIKSVKGNDAKGKNGKDGKGKRFKRKDWKRWQGQRKSGTMLVFHRIRRWLQKLTTLPKTPQNLEARRDVTSVEVQSTWPENATSRKRTTHHRKEPQKVTKEKQTKASPKEENEENPVKRSHK